MADQELVGLSRVFDRMYCKLGRTSVAPEKLKSLLLIGLSKGSRRDLRLDEDSGRI